MAASLKLEQSAGTTAPDLDNVKLVTLEDQTGNKYTLDITGTDLKLGYQAQGAANPTTYIVDGLAKALGGLLSIEGTTAGKTILQEKVAAKPVVEAILNVEGTTAGKTILQEKVAAKPVVEAILNVEGTTAGKTILQEKVAAKPVVEAILNVEGTTAGKTILQEKVAAKPVVEAILNVEGTTAGKTILQEKVAAKPVVEAILDAVDSSGASPVKIVEAELAKTFVQTANLGTAGVVNPIIGSTQFKAAVLNDSGTPITGVADLVTKLKAGTGDNGVYTKAAAEGAFVKVDGSNATSHSDKGKTLAKAILAAKDGDKLVLVDELGKALETKNADYGTSQTAQAFLGEKGLKPTAAEVAAVLAADDIFKAAVTISANAADSGFKSAVKAAMTPVFEIPTDESAPLSWDF